MTQHYSIGRLSSRITNLSHLYLNNHLQKYGISSGQLPILMRLYHQDDIHQETISHDLLLDKTTCTRAIKKLIDAGFIIKDHDPADKRAYKIKLTNKAINQKKEIRHALHNWRTILLADFTQEEQKQFLQYLHRTIDNAQHHLYQKEQQES